MSFGEQTECSGINCITDVTIYQAYSKTHLQEIVETSGKVVVPLDADIHVLSCQVNFIEANAKLTALEKNATKKTRVARNASDHVSNLGVGKKRRHCSTDRRPSKIQAIAMRSSKTSPNSEKCPPRGWGDLPTEIHSMILEQLDMSSLLRFLTMMGNRPLPPLSQSTQHNALQYMAQKMSRLGRDETKVQATLRIVRSICRQRAELLHSLKDDASPEALETVGARIDEAWATCIAFAEDANVIEELWRDNCARAFVSSGKLARVWGFLSEDLRAEVWSSTLQAAVVIRDTELLRGLLADENSLTNLALDDDFFEQTIARYANVQVFSLLYQHLEQLAGHLDLIKNAAKRAKNSQLHRHLQGIIAHRRMFRDACHEAHVGGATSAFPHCGYIPSHLLDAIELKNIIREAIHHQHFELLGALENLQDSPLRLYPGLYKNMLQDSVEFRDIHVLNFLLKHDDEGSMLRPWIDPEAIANGLHQAFCLAHIDIIDVIMGSDERRGQKLFPGITIAQTTLQKIIQLGDLVILKYMMARSDPSCPEYDERYGNLDYCDAVSKLVDTEGANNGLAILEHLMAEYKRGSPLLAEIDLAELLIQAYKGKRRAEEAIVWTGPLLVAVSDDESSEDEGDDNGDFDEEEQDQEENEEPGHEEYE